MKEYHLRPTPPPAPASPRDPNVPLFAAAPPAAKAPRRTPAKDSTPRHGLTAKQIQSLVILAKEAFAVAKACHADDLEEHAWRHAESIKACGLRISDARNEHYLALKTHFQTLAGSLGKAFESAQKDTPQSEEWRRAVVILQRELDRLDYGTDHQRWEYASKLMHGARSANEASPKQLWCAIYTLRNRTTKKAKFVRTVKAKANATVQGSPNREP